MNNGDNGKDLPIVLDASSKIEFKKGIEAAKDLVASLDPSEVQMVLKASQIRRERSRKNNKSKTTVTIEVVPEKVPEPTQIIQEPQSKELTVSEVQLPVREDSQEKPTTLKNVLELLDIESKFTEKQIKFLTEFSKCGVITKAGRAADYGKHQNQELSALLKEPRSLTFLKMLREKAISEAALTSAEVVAKARKVYDKAMEAGDFKAAMMATESLAKFQGMNVERSEHVSKNLVFTSGDSEKDVKKDMEAFKEMLSVIIPGLNAKNVTPKK